MSLDDQAPQADEPGSTGRRRRSPRPWSSPPAAAPAPPAPAAPTEERVDRPLSETAWGWKPESTDNFSFAAPAPAEAADAGPDATLAAVEALSAELQSQLALLRVTIAETGQRSDSSLVTGAELGATIESLGTSLGTGMAALLSDHRALLARDLEAAADRILDEVGQRLRANATQTMEGLEERVRQLTTKGLNSLGEQLELRLDQLQADVTGLRAVMLEIPDQTVVTSRLDKLADSVGEGSGRRDQNRLSPAMTAAVERAVAGPVGRLEATLATVTEAVQDLDARMAERGVSVDFGGLGDPAAIEELTAEMAALRRRISLRSDAEGPAAPPAPAAPPVTDEDEDRSSDEDHEDDAVVPVPIVAPAAPARRAGRTVKAGRSAKPAPKPAAKKAAKASKAASKPSPRRRRSAD